MLQRPSYAKVSQFDAEKRKKITFLNRSKPKNAQVTIHLYKKLYRKQYTQQHPNDKLLLFNDFIFKFGKYCLFKSVNLNLTDSSQQKEPKQI